MKRYEIDGWEDEGYPNGVYILHSDHAAEVAKLQSALTSVRGQCRHEEGLRIDYYKQLEATRSQLSAALAALEGVRRDAAGLGDALHAASVAIDGQAATYEAAAGKATDASKSACAFSAEYLRALAETLRTFMPSASLAKGEPK